MLPAIRAVEKDIVALNPEALDGMGRRILQIGQIKLTVLDVFIRRTGMPALLSPNERLVPYSAPITKRPRFATFHFVGRGPTAVSMSDDRSRAERLPANPRMSNWSMMPT